MKTRSKATIAALLSVVDCSASTGIKWGGTPNKIPPAASVPPQMQITQVEPQTRNRISFCLFVTQSALVFSFNVKLLGGKTNAEVAEDWPSLLSPAGWAFSIWALIYAGELVFVSAPLVWDVPKEFQRALHKSAPPFWAANILQALWALSFSREHLVASAILLTAIALFLGIAVLQLFSPQNSMFQFHFFFVIMHAGWAAAATIVSWSIALVACKSSLAAQISFAFCSLSAAFALGAAAIFKGGVFIGCVYASPIGWAFLAIASELSSKHLPRIDPSCREALSITSKVYAVALAALLIFSAMTSPSPVVSRPSL